MSELSDKFTQKSRDIPYPKEDTAYLAAIKEHEKAIDELKSTHKARMFVKRQQYRDEQYKIDEEFKLALFEEYGVEAHPKRERIFSRAWEDGHASGYSEVEHHFSVLVELIE